jgi:hypothetical protein
VQKAENEQLQWFEKVPEYKLFLDSIKSSQTKLKYSSYFKKYLEITGIDLRHSSQYLSIAITP